MSCQSLCTQAPQFNRPTRQQRLELPPPHHHHDDHHHHHHHHLQHPSALTSPGGHRTPWPRSAPQKPSLEPLRRLGARVERVREQRASKGMTRHDPVNFWMFLYDLLYFCYPFEAWNIIVRNIYIYVYIYTYKSLRAQTVSLKNAYTGYTGYTD